MKRVSRLLFGLLLLPALAVLGCGSPTPGGGPDGDDAEIPGSGDGEIRIEVPDELFQDYRDLLSAFRQFGYRWIDEGRGEARTVEWEILGEEVLDEAAVRHLAATFSEYGVAETSEVWFDEDWTAVKALVDGREVFGWEAEAAGLLITTMAQSYVNYCQLAEMVFAESGGPGLIDGAAFALESRSSQTLIMGSRSVPVDRYRIESRWVDAFWELGVSRVDGRRIYVILTQGVDGAVHGIAVTRAARQ